MGIFWTLCIVVITVINYFSIRSIRENTKLLGPDLGVYANEKFIRLYNGCFVAASIFDIVSLALFSWHRDFNGCMEIDKDPHSKELYRE